MTAVERALRHIEKLQRRLIKALPPQTKRENYKSRRIISAKPAKSQAKRAKKAPKRASGSSPRVVSKRRRHKRREPYNPPVTHPDFTELREAFAPPPPAYELSVTAAGARAVEPMSDAQALARGILPNGELLDDVEDETPGRISPALYRPEESKYLKKEAAS